MFSWADRGEGIPVSKSSSFQDKVFSSNTYQQNFSEFMRENTIYLEDIFLKYNPVCERFFVKNKFANFAVKTLAMKYLFDFRSIDDYLDFFERTTQYEHESNLRTLFDEERTEFLKHYKQLSVVKDKFKLLELKPEHKYLIIENCTSFINYVEKTSKIMDNILTEDRIYNEAKSLINQFIANQNISNALGLIAENANRKIPCYLFQEKGGEEVLIFRDKEGKSKIFRKEYLPDKSYLIYVSDEKERILDGTSQKRVYENKIYHVKENIVDYADSCIHQINSPAKAIAEALQTQPELDMRFIKTEQGKYYLDYFSEKAWGNCTPWSTRAA